MGLESATFFSDLVTTNPTESDNVGTTNDHLQLLKTVCKNQFTGGASGLSGAVTVTHTELNRLAGVTSNIQTQLNTLDTGKVATTAAGRWTQIGSTATASTTATIDFINGVSSVVIDGTYDYYLIELVAFRPATDADVLWLRTTTNASSFGNTSYVYQQIYADHSAPTTVVAAGSAGGGASSIVLSLDVGGNANELGFYGHILISKPSTAGYCHFQWVGSHLEANSGELVTISGAGHQGLTTDVDGFRLMYSTGNIASGTARLFGRVK